MSEPTKEEMLDAIKKIDKIFNESKKDRKKPWSKRPKCLCAYLEKPYRNCPHYGNPEPRRRIKP